MLKEIRCTYCGKVLLEHRYEHEATNSDNCDMKKKCPKCKAMNKYKMK